MNPFVDVVKDLRVLGVCVSANVPVTDSVLSAVWSWFRDVEFALPISVMPLTNTERDTLIGGIVAEMIDLFGVAERKWDASGGSGDPSEVAPTEIAALDALWRELAACYAELINDTLPDVEMNPDQEEAFYGTFIERTAHTFDVAEDEIREALQNDSSFRMMIRMQGFDPDRVR